MYITATELYNCAMKNFQRCNWNLSFSHPVQVQIFEHPPGQDPFVPDIHSAVHIGWMLSGDSIGVSCGERVVYREGELYLTAPWELHGAISSPFGDRILLLTADPDEVKRFLLSGGERLEKLYRLSPGKRMQILNSRKYPSELLEKLLLFMEMPDSLERTLRLWHAVLGVFIEIANLSFPEELDPDASSDYRRLLPALEHLGNSPLSVPEAAELCGLSQSRFSHLFTQVFSMPFARYERLYRLRCAMEELRRTGEGLKEAAENWGFYDKSHFSRIYRRSFRRSPGKKI